ncbi:MAG: HNH endonuclease [Micropruina sp.]|nr:HNH endonuclease [Micropruina sp.]
MGARNDGTRWAGSRVTKAREFWKPRVAAGLACSRCKKPILPGQSWQVDHLIPREFGGMELGLGNTWPAHSRCNTSAGGKRGAAITNSRAKTKNNSSAVTKSELDRGIRGV